MVKSQKSKQNLFNEMKYIDRKVQKNNNNYQKSVEKWLISNKLKDFLNVEKTQREYLAFWCGGMSACCSEKD